MASIFLMCLQHYAPAFSGVGSCLEAAWSNAQNGFILLVAYAVQNSGLGGADDKLISYQEQAVQQLCAPVTVKAIKAAVGELHLPEFLQQYA